MSKFYKNGFYDTEINAGIPVDAVAITTDYWSELLQGQSAGKRIQPDESGYPVLVDPPGKTRAELLELLKNKIDAETDKTILTGFQFNGQAFKLSLENQMNFKTECELRENLTYPHKIKTVDGYYELQNAEEYRLLYLAAVAFIRQTIEIGWTKKDNLDAMSDEELVTLLEDINNE